MDLSKEKLSDRDVKMIIAGWEAMKPKEPNYPEPLFIWPRSLGFHNTFIYLTRLWSWKRKMKATSWGFFHQRYQQWMFMITDHLHALVGDQDQFKQPQLVQLRDYQNVAQKRLQENTMSQAEWDRQKFNRH